MGATSPWTTQVARAPAFDLSAHPEVPSGTRALRARELRKNVDFKWLNGLSLPLWGDKPVVHWEATCLHGLRPTGERA